MAQVQRFQVGEPTPGSEPPESGGLPDKGKKILAKVYSSCRQDNPEYSKGKCSKIAWGGVKNAGYYQDKDGGWKHKNDENPREGIDWLQYWEWIENNDLWNWIDEMHGSFLWFEDDVGGGAGSQPSDLVDDKRSHGKRRVSTPRADPDAPPVPPSHAPKDPGREWLYGAGRPTPGGAGDTIDKSLGKKPKNPDDDMPAEEENVCMCGPKRELERYWDQENLQPVHFKVHISEHATEKIPYFAKILAAYPTTSLNGREYTMEVLNDAAKPYIGQPFIMDHQYDDSFKVHGKIIGASYGVQESPYLGRSREGLWLDAIGLMSAELVPMIQGTGAVPPILRGVSIGGEGDAEPTRTGMRLKRFFPTELSMTAFPGIPGAHIADFQTITESLKSADGRSKPMSQGRQGQVWTEKMPGGTEMVHIPDVVGIAHSQGQLNRQFGQFLPKDANYLTSEQERAIIAQQQARGVRVNYQEGPQVTSPDAFTRPENRQVPFAPGFPNTPPYPGYTSDPGVPSPGFSSVLPSTQGYDVAPGGTGQPWQRVSRNDWMQTPESVKQALLAMAQPAPIRDADQKKGAGEEEEEEEIRRHNAILQAISAKDSELGPVASDGSTVHGIAGMHKHLPDNDEKPDHARAQAVDNQPHAFAGGKMKKIPGEARVDLSKPGEEEEEEEEERRKAHGGLACEKVHGVLPHRIWNSYFASKEGTEPLGPGDQYRGDPVYDRGSQTSPRKAAKKVGTTSPGTGYDGEAKSPEEEEEEEEEMHRHKVTLINMRKAREGTGGRIDQGIRDPLKVSRGHGNINPVDYTPKGTAGEEEEEERLRMVRTEIARREAMLNGHEEGMRRAQAEDEERRRQEQARPHPFGMQFQGEAGPMITGHTREAGSGITQVTVNTLPQEYQARLQNMMGGYQRFMGIQPAQEARIPGAQQIGERTILRESYQDPNRYPTISTMGIPPNAQTWVSRSEGTINDVTRAIMAQAGRVTDNTQEQLNLGWKTFFNSYVGSLGLPKPYLSGRR